MKPFIHDDFLLRTETAKVLYHKYACNMPIIDFHNHLNAKDIYEDKCYNDLTEVWLGYDHYKWRALRTNGTPEAFITGDELPFNKYLAWVETVQNCIGNPLYHWTHLELKRYFGIDMILSSSTSYEVWDQCNKKLKLQTYSVRNLLRMQNVEVLCTTDDPIDDLKYHKLLRDDNFEIKVLPTFRPEKALAIEDNDFNNYIKKLSEISEHPISSVEDIITALKKRLLYFIQLGCKITDHSLENNFYLPSTQADVNAIYKKRLTNTPLSDNEYAMYKGFILTELGKEYSKHGVAMQLHIGAIRNNSDRMFKILGANSGFDSINDFNYAPQISSLLNAMDITNELPKTILYYLNPKDSDMLAAMAGNFQSNDSKIKGKVQLGSAWWFCDHKTGIERQLTALSDIGLLSPFIGMLTDSRSFLSFPRHEYFRRILCNKIGMLIDNGEYPKDLAYIGNMIKNICYYNAKIYLDV